MSDFPLHASPQNAMLNDGLKQRNIEHGDLGSQASNDTDIGLE